MSQLFISPELLGQLRALEKPYTRLLCESIGGQVLLARRLATTNPNGPPESYSPLSIEEDPGARSERRLACVFAEPPLERESIVIPPRLPLGLQRLKTLPGAPQQPYLKTLLEKETQLLVVGEQDVELIRARRWPAAGLRVWSRGNVVQTPPIPSEVGTVPGLRGRSVGIVGLGSVGSRVAAQLAAAGVDRLVLLDCDRLDIRNLRRHLCGPEFVGRFKVEAVAAVLERANFNLEVEPFAVGVPREDSPEIHSRLSECDLLICCADSSAAQHYINHLARKLGRPAVIAGVQLMPEALGEVVSVKPGTPGCLNCWRMKLEKEGVMMRGDAHDAADYPDPAPPTPQGMPAYHLDMVAAIACDFASRAHGDDSPCVWLNALQSTVSDFDDLKVQRPKIEGLEPDTTCLVCGGDER